MQTLTQLFPHLYNIKPVYNVYAVLLSGAMKTSSRVKYICISSLSRTVLCAMESRNYYC